MLSTESWPRYLQRGGGRAAVASFASIAQRLEAALRDNATAVGVLDTTVRSGLATAQARLEALPLSK